MIIPLLRQKRINSNKFAYLGINLTHLKLIFRCREQLNKDRWNTAFAVISFVYARKATRRHFTSESRNLLHRILLRVPWIPDLRTLLEFQSRPLGVSWC